MAKSSKKEKLKLKKTKGRKLTRQEKELMISKDPRSRPGLYYGSDGLKKIKLPDGTIRWVEKDVHPTRT